MVLEECKRASADVLLTDKKLRKNRDASCTLAVCRIMKYNNLATVSPPKVKKRAGVRFEKRFSNAIWYVDLHVMKNTSFNGLNLYAPR